MGFGICGNGLWVDDQCLVKFYDKYFILLGDGLSLLNTGSKVYYRLKNAELVLRCSNSNEVYDLLKCESTDHECCDCSRIVDNVMMASLTLGYKYYIASNKVYDAIYVNGKCAVDEDIENAQITESNTVKICGEELLVNDEFVEAFYHFSEGKSEDHFSIGKTDNQKSLINGLIYQFTNTIKDSKLDNGFNKSYM